MADNEVPRDVEVPRDPEVPREIKLKTEDGVVFSVTRDVIAHSVILKGFFEDLGLSKDPEPILLKKIDASTFRKVLEWCEHHVVEPIPAQGQMTPWDTEYVKLDKGTLFEIILAADFLEIQDLMNLGCKAIADMMKGKTVEEIREEFGIENDWEEGEEERLRQENAWQEDNEVNELAREVYRAEFYEPDD